MLYSLKPLNLYWTYFSASVREEPFWFSKLQHHLLSFEEILAFST